MVKYRFAAAVLLAASLCTLSGCVVYTDLADRAIVQSIGIDYLPDKKVYRISMQYFNQTSEGGINQIDKTQDNVLKSVGEGENIFAAAKNASVLTGKDMLLSENKLIIIGKELQQYDLGATLEFFTGNLHSHPQSFIAAAENTAEELLDIRFKEGPTSSQRLAGLLRNAASEGKGKFSYPYEVMTMLCSKTGSAYLPLLKTATLKTDITIPKDSGGEGGKSGGSGGEEQNEVGETTIIADGGVIFCGKKAQAEVDTDVSSVIQFLTDSADEYSFTVMLSEYGDPSVTLTGITRSVKAKVQDGKAVFDISLNASGKVAFRGKLEEYQSKAYKEVEKASEEKLRDMIVSAVAQVKDGYGCDVFGFENALRRDCNGFYNENADNMKEIIQTAGYNVRVEVDVR
ncbi:MAG: Ger(x)C family spore germination C-terminal domain-containing protein [Ruminiclostridium sp.]